MKTFSILFIFLFFVSCGKSGNGGSVSPDGAMEADSVELADISADRPVPVAALTWDIKAELVNFSRSQEDKVQKTIELIKEIVASEEFKNKILNKTYKGKKQFVDNGGLSNAQIYQKILDGRELMTNLGKNNRMDVELELYRDTNSTTIGYTFPSVVRIWMNRKYFDKFLPYQVADNMVHEWLHKLGFKHSQEMNAARPHSVPYWIGYLVRDMAKLRD